MTSRRDPLRLYAFALREDDAMLAELVRRRLTHRARDLLLVRVRETLRRRSR